MKTDIEKAEARAAELHDLYAKSDRTAAFHERNDHATASAFRRRADAWLADYEDAVRDLRRFRADDRSRSA